MKYYLVYDSNEPEKLVKIGASGFTPANSYPLSEDLAKEDAEWLELQDVYQTQLVPSVDGEGNPIYTEEPLLGENDEPILDEDENPVFKQAMEEAQVFSHKAVTVNEDLKAQILAERASQAAAQAQKDALRAMVRNAVAFGSELMEDFIMENITLGITQDNMSESVLDAMAPVEAALRTGTLHVAIERLKSIPIELKDEKYITDIRLLEAMNKIEAYLGLPLSQEL
jgi:hypothetical protein